MYYADRSNLFHVAFTLCTTSLSLILHRVFSKGVRANRAGWHLGTQEKYINETKTGVDDSAKTPSLLEVKPQGFTQTRYPKAGANG